MTLTIVVLDGQERFLQFLDPELCSLKETTAYGALRTLEIEYQFQDFQKDKELFKIGNKIWVQGDINLSDCLYVINTEIEEDVYKENKFSLEVEEILVELNYAPLFSQTELSNTEFRKVTTNGQQQIVVNWNALNYFFRNYFNIGVVQDCISEYAQRVTLTGTMTLMAVLRSIEEQTGNVFVTRYEKDVLDNTIHRYLDFLNPINVSKNWTLNLEYNFQSNEILIPVTDEDDNPTEEDKPYEVLPYTTDLAPESLDEDDNPPVETETVAPSTYDKEDDVIYDYENSPDYTPITNLNPDVCVLRLTDGENVLLADNDEKLEWSFSDAGIDGETLNIVIGLCKYEDVLGVSVNNSSYAVVGDYDMVKPPAYISAFNQGEEDLPYLTILEDNERSVNVLPDDCFFEIYDEVNDKILFNTQLNIEIGKVHEEVLDFGYNLENIQYNIDETNTYTAIAPVLQLSESQDASKSLSNADLSTIINRWKNLTVNKGEVIPMIVQKINQEGTSLANAKTALGTYNKSTNYWARPLKPTDNVDSNSKQYEFFRASAYWKAPYSKKAGELYITTENVNTTQYQNIYTRKDIRDERNTICSPKIGTTDSTDEDVYAIYNQVALYLKEHETPSIEIEVDVANLRNSQYNQYELHDKVYIKVPDSQELITARVTKTEKEAHDIAKNTIELSNYKSLNTIRTITQDTFIEASNVSFNYPRSKILSARLVNSDYDNTDYYSIQYPANKLLSFAVYKNDNGSKTFTGKVYTKRTDAYGYASIVMRFDPGDYEIEISFAGDEIYTESTHSINVNVAGTLDVVPKMVKKQTKAKTTAKTTTNTTKKTKIVKTYWNKCGLSPDKKHSKIIAIAQPSAGDGNYSYNTLWKTVFKNRCPECGGNGTLRFDGGKKNKCITSAGAHGRGYKIKVPEHEITCIRCDSDYDGVTGLEKNYGHSTRLKRLKKPVKSSKAEFGKLVKGKLVYESKKVTVTPKSVTNNKTRYIRAKGISSKVKKKGLAIVGNSTGLVAAKKVATWMDKHISYAGYRDFQRSPSTCLSKGSANCCDGTRLLFQLMDSAGLCQYFDLYYIHVYGHVYGQVVTKKTGRKRYVDCASDVHEAWGYICRDYRGRGVLARTKYPKLPF